MKPEDLEQIEEIVKKHSVSDMLTFLVIMFLLYLAGCFNVDASEIPPDYANRLADAIYVAEGGDRAKVPYGILSVRVRDKDEARRVCLNTIRNNWRRWEEDGKRMDYLTFLGRRYCPPSVDLVGHRNWLKNVKAQLNTKHYAN